MLNIVFESKEKKNIPIKKEFVEMENSLKDTISFSYGKTVNKKHFGYKIVQSDDDIKTNDMLQLNPYSDEKTYMEKAEEIKTIMSLCECRPIYFDMTKAIIYKYLKLYPVEKVEPFEFEHLSHVRNSFIYLKENDCFIKKGYQYDINSFFPFVLQSKDFYFPIRGGKMKTIRSIEELDDMFLYSVMLDVDYSNFPYMKDDLNKVYYSNYDVEMFLRVGVKFSISETGSGNVLYYDRCDCVSGKTVFGNMISELYNIKSSGNKVAGGIMRMIHGVLFQGKYLKLNKEKHPEKIIDIIDKAVYHDEKFIYYTDGDLLFKSGFARMKLFLYSYTRNHFHKTYIQDKDYEIFRIYIDSIIISKKLPDDLIGDEIGLMKFEGKYKNLTYEKVNKSYKSLFNKEADDSFDDFEEPQEGEEI
jgi:hypothetical protein